MSKTEILQYVKDTNGKKIGLVLAKLYPETNEVIISFSKQHRYLDDFDKEKGLEIANNRADKFYNTRHFGPNQPRLHSCVEPVFIQVMTRAINYFKQAKVLAIPHRNSYEELNEIRYW